VVNVAELERGVWRVDLYVRVCMYVCVYVYMYPYVCMQEPLRSISGGGGLFLPSVPLALPQVLSFRLPTYLRLLQMIVRGKQSMP
jgi:hypothetical protein